MTPEKARALLEAATPGEWRTERQDGFLYTVFPTPNGVPEESDLHLIAAAPDLAELVAGLRHEYAVQEDVGYWRQRGEWLDTFEEAADYRDMKREDAPMRIVRRLAGDPEVVTE